MGLRANRKGQQGCDVTAALIKCLTFAEPDQSTHAHVMAFSSPNRIQSNRVGLSSIMANICQHNVINIDCIRPVLIVCMCVCEPDDVSLYLTRPFVNNEATSPHIHAPDPKSPPEFDNGSPTNCGLERDHSRTALWRLPRQNIRQSRPTPYVFAHSHPKYPHLRLTWIEISQRHCLTLEAVFSDMRSAITANMYECRGYCEITSVTDSRPAASSSWKYQLRIHSIIGTSSEKDLESMPSTGFADGGYSFYSICSMSQLAL